MFFSEHFLFENDICVCPFFSKARFGAYEKEKVKPGVALRACSRLVCKKAGKKRTFSFAGQFWKEVPAIYCCRKEGFLSDVNRMVRYGPKAPEGAGAFGKGRLKRCNDMSLFISAPVKALTAAVAVRLVFPL